MSMFGARITGATEIEAALSQMSKTARAKALTSATRKGIAMFRKEARARAPRDRERLRRGIKVRTNRRKRFQVSLTLGLTRDAFHGLLQEFGTEHHPAQPFMRPAFLSQVDKVVRSFGANMWAAIRKSRTNRR